MENALDMESAQTGLSDPESIRLKRTHMPARSAQIGKSVREADRSLGLTGGNPDLLDATHFDTVRFPAPHWAKPLYAQAEADGSLAYTPYRGHPAVLEALQSSVGALLGTPVNASNVALTPGSQAGLFTTLSALVDEGDLVLLADPDYLFVERILAFLGARVERIPVIEDGDVALLDLDRIEWLLPERPKLFVFSHPNNPTGAAYGSDTINRLAELAVAGNFRVLVDQLYCRLVYPGFEYVHLAGVDGMADRCITILGPSKTESLTGYRVGVVVGPTDVMSAVEQTLTVTSLRAPAYGQHLLTKWLVEDDDFVRTRIAELAQLRDLTIKRLLEVPGLRLKPREGTAYVFPDVSDLGRTDEEIAAALQREANVIVSPGYQFGPRGVGHFRACYARDENQWADALKLIVDCLTKMA
jgi:aspartate/methionine/tyrosine aminotransferase